MRRVTFANQVRNGKRLIKIFRSRAVGGYGRQLATHSVKDAELFLNHNVIAC